ncbi:hypothetical protein HU200_058970 [Digitaria exilis]|uniref:Cytochrome P450 n=1 Tax=Digitaria exilis TaxID=1010633 RepID=A0A835AIC5_9POAL|nr:hypothetical protein HU200_058970 [Digitaria exilis]
MDDLSCNLYFLARVLVILIPLLLASLKLRTTMRKHKPRLPPGPWRLPVIGHLHHLAKTPLIHRALADLARRCNAPVMYLRLGELDAVVVSSAAAAGEVMRTHDVAMATRPMSATVRATAAGGLGIAFSPYGERWRELRKLSAMELLSASRVRSFRAVREDEATSLVAGIAAAACPPGGELVNVTARVAASVSDSALRAMMGERFERREELLETITQVLKIGTGFNMGDLFPSSRLVAAIDGTVRIAQAMQRKLFQLVDYAIEQHRERRSGPSAATDAEEDEHLLDVLLRIHVEGGLGCSLHEPCKILGYDVLKGTIVLVNAWAICRDPKYWDEPEVFKPERFEEGATDFMGTDFHYTPFGAGRRICPGIAFALANVELVLAALLFHFDWHLPPGVTPSELDMAEEMGVTLAASRKFQIKFIPFSKRCKGGDNPRTGTPVTVVDVLAELP